MPNQRRNVFPPLAQGRNRDREDVETKEKVLTELAFPDCLLQILAGGRDHTNIYLDGVGGAQSLEFPFLENPQQFGL